MSRPPRDTSRAMFNRSTGPRWVGYGVVLALASMVPLIWGPDTPSTTGSTASQTMAYAVLGIGTALSAIVMRRDTAPSLRGPLVPYVWWPLAGLLMTLLGTEVGFLQRWLDSQPLTGGQWLVSFALAVAAMAFVEVNKWLRRTGASRPSGGAPVGRGGAI